MPSARPWLPAGLVHDSALSQALAPVVESWARHWIADPKSTSVQAQPVTGRIKLRSDLRTWSTPECDFVLTIDTASEVKLAQSMLGATAPRGRQIMPADEKVLRAIAAPALLHLATIAKDFFGANGGCASSTHEHQVEDGSRFTMAFAAGGASLDVYVSRDRAVETRKHLVSRSDSAGTLAPMGDALAPQSLNVGARLGASTLTLPQLRTLAAGDVIILDTGLSDELTLTVNGEPKTFAQCLFVPDSAPQLRLTNLEGNPI